MIGLKLLSFKNNVPFKLSFPREFNAEVSFYSSLELVRGSSILFFKIQTDGDLLYIDSKYMYTCFISEAMNLFVLDGFLSTQHNLEPSEEETSIEKMPL